MTKLLVNLLRVDNRDFNNLIDRLERLCLNPSIDIRLSTEILSKTRDKARMLGLDVDDTTPKELHYSLVNLLKVHDKELSRKLKFEKRNPEQTAKIIAKVCSKLSRNEKTLAISPVGAKKLLKAVPPRKTIKALRLRSLDAILKREDPRLIYAIAKQIEDSSWKSQVFAWMKRIPAKDLTWRSVEVLSLNKQWCDKIIHKIAHNGFKIECQEVGIVVVLPVVEAFTPGVAVLELGLILHSAQRVAINSLPYRRNALMLGYHDSLLDLAQSNTPILFNVNGLQTSWRAIHEIFSRGFLNDEMFDSDFAIDDMGWQSTEMKLAAIIPEMDFWVGTHYLGKQDEPLPVSMHVLDIASSLVRSLDYGKQSISHLEGSLWNEIQIRYLSNDVMTRSLVHQLKISENMLL